MAIDGISVYTVPEPFSLDLFTRMRQMDRFRGPDIL